MVSPLVSRVIRRSGRSVTGRITVSHKGNNHGITYKYYKLQSVNFFLKLPSVVVNIFKSYQTASFVGLLKFSNGAYAHSILSSVENYGTLRLCILSKYIRFIKLKFIFTTILKFFKPSFTFFNLILDWTKCKYAKSAGVFCLIVEVSEKKASVLLELPTKVRKWVHWFSVGTLGRVSNTLHNKEYIGKAGFNRIRCIRPTVRGVAMNPVDHPHGGRTKTNSPEVTPWGRIAKKGK